jgi:glycosyltransferase involved in cell wall biosynthesis
MALRGDFELLIVNVDSEFEIDSPIVNTRSFNVNRRVGLYEAWNVLIKASSGDYIVPANVDDKFSPDYIEIMSAHLDADKNLSLVYPSGFYTDDKEATWEDKRAYARLPASPFRTHFFMHGCYIHPHPMWRRSLHDKYGWFDETLKSAGDYEWYLRLAAGGEAFAYEARPLSLMYKGGDTLGNSNMALSAAEANIVRSRYSVL